MTDKYYNDHCQKVLSIIHHGLSTAANGLLTIVQATIAASACPETAGRSCPPSVTRHLSVLSSDMGNRLSCYFLYIPFLAGYQPTALPQFLVWCCNQVYFW